MTELFMGFDAGGSKTVCLVGDGATILGRGEAGPANPSVNGVDGFRRAIADASGRALRATSGDVAGAWIGVAGGDTAPMREALRQAAMGTLDLKRVWISHDGLLVLAAAGMRTGIALVAGTGSVVYGRGTHGGQVTVGGWGHLLGDEGSGYDIARQALRAVTQAADGRGPATRLSAAIADAWGAVSMRELRERSYPAPAVPEVARLARLVLELAAEDDVAARIVGRAAQDLALAVRTCRERLAESEPADLPVVLAGGLLAGRSALAARLTAELQRDGGYQVVPLDAEPAIGALALARDGPDQQQEEDAVARSDDHTEQQLEETVS